MESLTETPFVDSKEDSYFDGGVFQRLGWKILGALVTIFTFGICYPFAICWFYSWETKHTVINGRRLKFQGTAGGLFGTWIICFLISIVTFGIYAFYVPIKIRKWRESNTFFEDEVPTFDAVQKLKKEKASYFDGGFWQLLGWKLLGVLITVFTLGICYPWAIKMLYGWEQKHKVYNHKRCTFEGTAGGLLGTWLLCMLLSVITLGIYTWWVPIRIKKWQIKHTCLLGDEISVEEQEVKNFTAEEVEARKLQKEKNRKKFIWVFLIGVTVLILSLFLRSDSYLFHFIPRHFVLFNPIWFIGYINNNLLYFIENLLKFTGVILLAISCVLKLIKQKYIQTIDLIGVLLIGLYLLFTFVPVPRFLEFWITQYFDFEDLIEYGFDFGSLCNAFRRYFGQYYNLDGLLSYLVTIIGYVITVLGFAKIKE